MYSLLIFFIFCQLEKYSSFMTFNMENFESSLKIIQPELSNIVWKNLKESPMSINYSFW